MDRHKIDRAVAFQLLIRGVAGKQPHLSAIADRVITTGPDRTSANPVRISDD